MSEEILRVCDFFSGFHSWTKPLEKRGIPHRVFSIDNNPAYADSTTIIGDFLSITPQTIIDFFGGQKPHVILASPPCTTYSIASCSTHWFPPTEDGSRIPRSEAAKVGLRLLEHLLFIIEEMDVPFFFENPRGLMRKMDCVQGIERSTVWYCRYGRTDGILRAKPTDIFHNSKTWIPRPVCKNGNPECDHERAPRGAKTGTQGMKGNAARSLIPFELCEEIMEAYLKEVFG